MLDFGPVFLKVEVGTVVKSQEAMAISEAISLQG